MCGGGSDVQWGNGQPGNQSYDPNYGTPQQAPTVYTGGPNAIPTFDPESTGGNIFTANAVTPSGSGGTGNGGGGALPSSSGSPGFDIGTGINGADFSYLNSPGVQSVGGDQLGGVPGYGATDLSGLPVPGGTSANVLTGNAATAAAPAGPVGGGGLPTDLSAVNKDQTRSTPAASSEGKSVLDSLGLKNPIGAAIGAAGLGYAAINNKAPAYTPQLKAQADALSGQGQQLLSYLQSGTLPAGLKASLDQATAAAKAKIISNFAGQGLNTDPNQNSALQAELAAVDQQALISTAQIGQQLMTTGIQEAGLSSDLYKTLSNIDQTQTANIGKAIANFASSVSGGGGGTTIKLG